MRKATFDFDPRIANQARIMVPVRDGVPVLDTPLVDLLIWPRDVSDSKGEVNEPKLRRELSRGKVLARVPAGAETSWASAMPKALFPAEGASMSIRQAAQKAVESRFLVIYASGYHDSPLRVAVHPAFTEQDIGDIARSAGYESSFRGPAKRLGSLSLLTLTTKMSCFSFNLPAGPPELLGSCPSSSLALIMQTGSEMVARQARRTTNEIIDPAAYICNGCYALKGNYQHMSVQLAQQLRYLLVRKLLGMESRLRVVELGDEESVDLLRKFPEAKDLAPQMAEHVMRNNLGREPRSFVAVMVRAIKRSEKLQPGRGREKSRYTVVEYMQEELLSTGQRMMKERLGTLSRAKNLTEAERREMAELRQASLRVRNARPRRDWHDQDTSYFRIHDAGDFFSPRYLQAWIDVAKRIPNVKFWAPTRAWAVKAAMPPEVMSSVPSNLAIRPSALHFRQAAPQLGEEQPFLAAGSGASSFVAVPDDGWNCPAYLHWTVGGGALLRNQLSQDDEGAGGNCRMARGPSGEHGCRVCWDHPELEVYYHEH